MIERRYEVRMVGTQRELYAIDEDGDDIGDAVRKVGDMPEWKTPFDEVEIIVGGIGVENAYTYARDEELEMLGDLGYVCYNIVPAQALELVRLPGFKWSDE